MNQLNKKILTFVILNEYRIYIEYYADSLHINQF